MATSFRRDLSRSAQWLHERHLLFQDVSVGDVESRKILKNQFKRNFTWFLENVFPELGIPDRGSFAYGGVSVFSSSSFFSF